MILSFFAFLIGAAVEIPNLRESPGRQTDSGIMSIVSLSGFVAGEALARTLAWLPHWVIEFGPGRSLVGLFLLVAAVTLRGQARRELAGAFRYSLRIDDGQFLVTTGIYAHCRHPAYLGAHLFLAAVPMAGGSFVGLAASLLALPATLARIRREETLLEAAYGEAFREWKRRVPSRLMPR
ncbi:MAG: isoprenylcysteine carboxylmethyltransferase family protein [Fibrobacteres bacterium]|nr:isoprenylcysteine carboxylmethyltransferase family protein [Fibrobacterota bacterium]